MGEQSASGIHGKKLSVKFYNTYPWMFFAEVAVFFSTVTMREVLSIHIGQAGCQMGNACWELCESFNWSF